MSQIAIESNPEITHLDRVRIAEANKACLPLQLLRKRIGFTACFVALAFATSSLSAQLIDGFENYVDTDDMQDEWSGGELDETTPTPFGTKSLQNGGPTSGDGSGWAVSRNLLTPIDISHQDTFDYWVRRDPTSVGPLNFSGALVDSSGGSCVPENGIMVADTEWHLVSFDLANDCVFVDLDAISEVLLFITNRSGGPGDILGNFDDIRAAGLFADGFESGDTSSWAVP